MRKAKKFLATLCAVCMILVISISALAASIPHNKLHNDTTLPCETSKTSTVESGADESVRLDLLSRAYDEFGVDLSEMSFVSFDYLWSCDGDSLDAEYIPLKSILTDEYTTVLVGESLPDGVYYDNDDAYIIRLLTDNQLKFVHCQITPTTYSTEEIIDPNADLSGRIHTNYTILSEQVS